VQHLGEVSHVVVVATITNRRRHREVPVTAHRRHRVALEHDGVRGGHAAHVAKHGALGFVHPAIAQEPHQRWLVQLRRHPGQGAHDVDAAADREHRAGTPPEELPVAVRVARTHEPADATVPDDERVVADEVLGEPVAPAAVRERHQSRVRGAVERVRRVGGERRAQRLPGVDAQGSGHQQVAVGERQLRVERQRPMVSQLGERDLASSRNGNAPRNRRERSPQARRQFGSQRREREVDQRAEGQHSRSSQEQLTTDDEIAPDFHCS
jgi:hypothetical protein